MVKILKNILIIIVISSCNHEFENKCFEEQGEIITEVRHLKPFNKIMVYDVFRIYLVQDTSCYVEIEAGKNLIPYIITDIDTTNSLLNLYNNTECRWSRKYNSINLTLHFINLTSIKNPETCYIEALDTIRLNSLEVYARAPLGEMDLLLNCNYMKFSTAYTTAGKFIIRGKANTLELFIHNSSILIGDEMVAVNATVYQNSIADLIINVSNTMDAHIWSSGNIILDNKPDKIILDRTGKGIIIYK